MKVSEITDVSKCVGCALCESVCPKQCISMTMSDEGFLYPTIDEEQCIDCKACQKRCPVNTQVLNDAGYNHQRAVLAMCKSDAVYYKSSSGGVFYNLGNQIIENGGCVFGAAWTKNFELRHVCVDTDEGLHSLLGSKYIQSNASGIWKQVKDEVATGRPVLFSGTPCQVGALRSWFPVVPDNLYIVEVMCMGVPSPGLFSGYLKDMRAKLGGDIAEIRFREKRHFGSVRSQSLIIRSNCGACYARTRNTDPFFLQFLNCNNVRNSCYDCSFKSKERAADLTLGDCWGMNDKAMKSFGRAVVSMVLINTHKGADMMSRLSDAIDSSPIETSRVWEVQPMLTKSCPKGSLRDRIYKNAPIGEAGTYKYLKRLGGLTIKDALKSWAAHLLYKNT